MSYQAMAKRWARYVGEAGVVSHLSDLRRTHLAELTAGGVPAWVIGQRLGLRNLPTNSAAFAAEDSDEVLAAWQRRRRATESSGRAAPVRRKLGS